MQEIQQDTNDEKRHEVLKPEEKTQSDFSLPALVVFGIDKFMTKKDLEKELKKLSIEYETVKKAPTLNFGHIKFKTLEAKLKAEQILKEKGIKGKSITFEDRDESKEKKKW